MAFFKRWKRWFLGLLLLLGVVGAAFFFQSGKKRAEYQTAKVEQGGIIAIVSATGKVNAVVTVQVGSQVSGTIQKLFADFNSRVKKGQIIAQIDPALFNAQVEQAKAKLANDEANVEKAKVMLADTQRNLRRMEALLSTKLISQSDKDTAQTASDAAAADMKAAQTQVQQDRASLQLAKANLDYTTIASPVDGTVISRSVDVGQTVAASLQAPILFTIAQDLTEMQVDTSVDEADIGKIQTGQRAEFTVDAYPDRPFRGTVHDIYNQPVIVQNVVTYDAIIRVKNPDMLLKPGMTANITIEVGRKEDVLKLPNAALRYRQEKHPGLPVVAKAGRDHSVDVWVLRRGKEISVPVTLGLSDGNFTEVVTGDLKPGDRVITEKARTAGASPSSGGGRPPSLRF